MIVVKCEIVKLAGISATFDSAQVRRAARGGDDGSTGRGTPVAHGDTGEVLQDGLSLQDYGITQDVVLDGEWSFKDQTHNPQLALQLPPDHERHQWSFARQGSHQPLVGGERALFT